jgi:hypothetical protein
MRWISKTQPIYVNRGDLWDNENNGQTYEATSKGWILEEGSDFPLDSDFDTIIPYTKKVKYKNDKD